MFCRWLILVWLALGSVAAASDDSIEKRRAELAGELAAQLDDLAAKCEKLGMAPQAARTREILAPRRSGRTLLFAADHAAKASPPPANDRIKQWQAKLDRLRQDYAESLYGLAEEAAKGRHEQLALQLLFEVVHEHPEHQKARQVLGLRKPGEGDRTTRPARPRAPSGDHREFGWRGGRYWELDSRHFRIETNLSAAACQDLAGELEQLHDVWLQLFFPVWSEDESLAERFEGRAKGDLLPSRRFRVVLFKDRDEYVRQLSKSQRNVGVSSGIYFDEQKVSVLAGGPDAKKATWHHEVTHQLFQEYLDVPAGVARQQNIWMVEAVAQFMESIALADGCATIGGYDADQLQYARARGRGGDFYLPLAELTKLGREPLQSHENIRNIYGQMAGLGHFFMEGKLVIPGDRPLREPFLRALVEVYRGRDDADSLMESVRKASPEAASLSYQDLDQQYYHFLDVTDAMIAAMPPHAAMRSLSLRRTSVTDAGLAAFSQCDKLVWLDLTLTAVGDQGVAAFPPSKELQQMFLERTKITDAALEHVALFPNLTDLYLSGTSLTDEGIAKLSGLKKLTTLDLGECALSDACLPALQSLKELETLETKGTRITPEGRAGLKRSLPKLKN